MKIVTVQQMRAIEQASVALGVSLEQLQRNAAEAVAREIERLFKGARDPVLFLIGPGNNGRDALIAAELLMQRGWAVRVYLAPKVGSEDVVAHLRCGDTEIHAHCGADSYCLLRSWVRDASVVVDGLLGIGIKGAVREPMASIIDVANEESAARRVPMVAVDLPSGVDADTGEVPGCAIRASFTVSLGAVKAGLLKLPAAEYVGKLLPVGIGLPPGSYESVPLELLCESDVADLLPPRPLNAHKGTFGRVLVVAGSRNFVGAAYLAGAAAARSGCGLVTLAVPEWQRAPIATLLPEATYLPLLDAVDEASAEANAQAVAELLPDCAALAIGPGLGQGPAQTRLVMAVLEAGRRAGGVPTVVDADALNALAAAARGEAGGGTSWWELIGPDHVLTPHPGEMSRLTGLSVAAIVADRWSTAIDAASRWGQTVVLKGAFTVVADPSKRAWVSPFAIPALATGGTGDVLTGLVAGLMAQGLRPTAAARAAVFLHAAAAQLVLEREETDRLLASDLLAAIPATIKRLVSNTRSLTSRR